MSINKVLIFLFVLTSSCKNNAVTNLSDKEIWNLGWKMIENSWDKKYQIAESQFDSLINSGADIEMKFLVIGLEVKNKLEKESEIENILKNQNQEVLRTICWKQFLLNKENCIGFSKEKIGNEALQMELLKMHINDQAVRGNVMDDIISIYDLDTFQITQNDAYSIDEENQARLKEIIEEYGFPNKKLVGKHAMDGVFMIIQHSDRDPEWQNLSYPI